MVELRNAVPSYVKMRPSPVPTAACTVTTVRLVPPPNDSAKHVIAVTVVHDVLLHALEISSNTVGLMSLAPKLNPNTVTEANDVMTPLATLLVYVTTGAAQNSR